MEVSLSPRGRTIVIWIGVIAGAVLLLEAANALRPFAWAVITAYLLHPFVSMIHRRTRLPKPLITLWLYAMIGLLLTILAINFGPVLVDQISQFKDEIPKFSDDIETWINDNQQGRLDEMGIDSSYVNERLDEVGTEIANTLGKAALPVLFSTFSIAIELLIYLVASFYFIVHGDRFVMAFRAVLNRKYHAEFDRLLAEINATLGAYLRGQALLVLIMSTASFAVLSVLGVKYALIIAIATGFLELIPLVGPWIAGAIAVTVSIFQDTTPFGWSHVGLAVVIGLAYFALRQAEDAFVIPTVIGRFVHLHPLLVIFCVVVGTALGGILGLILAVPIAAVLKILISYLYAKLITREHRHVEVIQSREQLEYLVNQFPLMTNSSVVLLIEPNVLLWENLPLVRSISDAAYEHSVGLKAVTPDGIAGTLLHAVGIETTTVPSVSPIPAPSLQV
ncbi:MAG TPA: AI-2E family transporter [Thermomicrobiales bacterium]|jgi:predicted PurR-regulated permease PerM|nr:AI-2E family transporter [Thermomicrobiales bacterium]